MDLFADRLRGLTQNAFTLLRSAPVLEKVAKYFRQLLGWNAVHLSRVATPLLALSDVKVDRVWDRLLAAKTPVVARRDAGELIIDLRAVPDSDDDTVLSALEAACR